MPDPRPDRHIDYVELTATDLPRAKTFYERAFGWTFQDWGDAYASFEGAKVGGGIRAAERVEPGGPLVILYGRDLESIHRSILDAGGAVVEPTFSFPGGRRFHFADTEGNVLAVWSDRTAEGSPIDV